MKITRANVDEMASMLIDILDDSGQQVREAADVWLDEDEDRESRAEARETLEERVPELQGQLEDLLKVIS